MSIVETVLSNPEPDEPAHVLLRRSVLAMAEQDLENVEVLLAGIELKGREPALGAHARAVQIEASQRFTEALAKHLGLDARTDPRPHLMIGAAIAAANSAWGAWLAGSRKRDLRDLADQAFDLLDAGFASLEA
jgi:hypothetical protein